MKYFNKPETIHELCIIFSFISQKTGKNLMPENFYRNQMYSGLCRSFQRLWMSFADVRPLLPVNLKEVGHKSLFIAFFELKEASNSKILPRNLNQKTRIKRADEPSLSLTVKPITIILKTLTSFSKFFIKFGRKLRKI